MKKASGSKIA